MTKLAQGLIYLEYSEEQRLFHFNDQPNSYRDPSWKRLKAMTYSQAEEFTSHLEKRYSGELPPLETIISTLSWYFDYEKQQKFLIDSVKKNQNQPYYYWHSVWFQPLYGRFLYADLLVPHQVIVPLIENKTLVFKGFEDHQGEKMLRYVLAKQPSTPADQ